MHELAAGRERHERAFALLRTAGAGAAIALALVSTAAAQTASGHFAGRTQDVPIAGAYSYWDQASGGQDRAVKVAVSNAEFRADLLNDWYDRGAAVHEFLPAIASRSSPSTSTPMANTAVIRIISRPATVAAGATTRLCSRR
ncbi:MAG: hypothetical protein ABI900_07870 [Betaproteobacteria bacterium]